MLRVFLILSCLGMTGCASYFKRQQCEKVNWFEHGKSVALKGQWLTSDTMVNECRKAEAAMQESLLDQGYKSGREVYCSPSWAYNTGRDGGLYPREICEGPQINVLLAQYNKGVVDYCHPTNGYKAGASGKKYGNICPQNLEAAFLKEYRKGRKKYVEVMVENKNQDVRNIDQRIHSKRTDIYAAQRNVSSYETQKRFLEMQKMSTPANNLALTNQLDSQITSADSDLRNAKYKLSSEESSLSGMEKERTDLLNEIAELRAEIPGLSQE